MKTLQILSYQWKNLIRDRWIPGYFLVYLLITDMLIRFGGNGPKALVSLSNIMLLLIPLVSLIYGVLYLYQSREFTELLLSQPIRRSSLFAGLYGGLALPLTGAFLFGTLIPLIYSGTIYFTETSVLLSILGLGVVLSLIFTGIGFLFGLKYMDNRIKGFGYALVSWLVLAVLYDGMVMAILYTFGDYPLEKVIIALSVINPIDLARTGTLLTFDISALMGYTGALFNRFFGSAFGLILALSLLLAWTVLPVWRSLRLFSTRDF